MKVQILPRSHIILLQQLTTIHFSSYPPFYYLDIKNAAISCKGRYSIGMIGERLCLSKYIRIKKAMIYALWKVGIEIDSVANDDKVNGNVQYKYNRVINY